MLSLFDFAGLSLTERFHRRDDATHDSAYDAADRIPAAHPQTAECATGDTEQDVTDRMFRRSRQCSAACGQNWKE